MIVLNLDQIRYIRMFSMIKFFHYCYPLHNASFPRVHRVLHKVGKQALHFLLSEPQRGDNFAVASVLTQTGNRSACFFFYHSLNEALCTPSWQGNYWHGRRSQDLWFVSAFRCFEHHQQLPLGSRPVHFPLTPFSFGIQLDASRAGCGILRGQLLSQAITTDRHTMNLLKYSHRPII